MHIKEQGKLINAGIGKVGSECGKLERSLWHTRLIRTRWAILEIYHKAISLGYRAENLKERTTIPNNRV